MKIICEIGSCWKTFEQAKDSIQLAKNCGADAVKFQLFSHESLYGLPDPAPLFEGTVRSISENAIAVEWLPLLAEKARAVGIEFMCSAFSPELIDIVDPHVSTHKVASAELTHVRMLERLAKIGKPVILSTGASGNADISTALAYLEPCPVTILYCVAAYPARVVNFNRLWDLRARFGSGYSYGFSDHTTDATIIPKAAQEAGATVIEKHVNFFGVDCPDAAHSLSHDEFKAMCDTLKGKPITAANTQEQGMYLKHNRRLTATAEISAGDTLQEGVNFGIYRSLIEDTSALSPWLINQVNGQVSKLNLHPGQGISPQAVDL